MLHISQLIPLNEQRLPSLGHDHRSTRGPGPPGLGRRSAAISPGEWRNARRASRTAAGTPRGDAVSVSETSHHGGKPANQGGAIARDMAAFMWAIAQQVSVTP
jgi:hypothetical protein